jgi:hypothetical protein
MIRLLGAMAGVWLTTVTSQVPPPNPQLTTAAVEAARAEGDAMFRKVHAEALFSNETHANTMGLIQLRHRPSGFLCTFHTGAPQNRIVVFRSLTVGNDVGCITAEGAWQQTLFLFRTPEKSNAELLADAEREVRTDDPAVQPHTPLRPALELPHMSGFTPPEHLASSQASATHGFYNVLGKIGDWAVEYRFNGAPDVADLGPVLGAAWTATVAERWKYLATGGTLQAASAAPPASAAASDPKAEATALIAASNGADLFENVTRGKVVALLHRPSGFVCNFDPGQAENRVQIFANAVRGADVGCTTREADAVVSYFITKLPGALSLDQLMRICLADIKRTHPDVAPFEGPTVNLTMKPGSAPPVEHLTGRVIYLDHGEKAYSRVSVAIVRGWMVEQRVTVPIDKQTVADLVGELGMQSVLKQMTAEHA